MSRQGLDDMTLLSKVSNDEINKNLKERFDNDIIYVRFLSLRACLRRVHVRCTSIANVGLQCCG